MAARKRERRASGRKKRREQHRQLEGVPGKLKIAYFVTLKACLLYDCRKVIGIPLKPDPCGLMAVALNQ